MEALLAVLLLLGSALVLRSLYEFDVADAAPAHRSAGPRKPKAPEERRAA